MIFKQAIRALFCCGESLCLWKPRHCCLDFVQGLLQQAQTESDRLQSFCQTRLQHLSSNWSLVALPTLHTSPGYEWDSETSTDTSRLDESISTCSSAHVRGAPVASICRCVIIQWSLSKRNSMTSMSMLHINLQYQIPVNESLFAHEADDCNTQWTARMRQNRQLCWLTRTRWKCCASSLPVAVGVRLNPTLLWQLLWQQSASLDYFSSFLKQAPDVPAQPHWALLDTLLATPAKLYFKVCC